MGLVLCILVALAAWPVFANDTGACFKPPHVTETRRPVPQVIPPWLYEEMIGWIARNTDYDLELVYKQPPTLSFCEVGDVIDYEDGDLFVDKSLLAVFDAKARHIYLTQPWTPLNRFQQSILLHEIIHDVQAQNREWACIGAPEPEAYRLQHKWLVERGILYPFNWDVIWRLGQCPTSPDQTSGDFRKFRPDPGRHEPRTVPDLRLLP